MGKSFQALRWENRAFAAAFENEFNTLNNSLIQNHSSTVYFYKNLKKGLPCLYVLFLLNLYNKYLLSKTVVKIITLYQNIPARSLADMLIYNRKDY
ncbi:MAG: hypothetical protein BGO39_08045 [Chloroflexi bacterium 54-19]|nr:MAG: hypothetical protein BGO39_08045 [Chloroflexi bacterium 54-19]